MPCPPCIPPYASSLPIPSTGPTPRTRPPREVFRFPGESEVDGWGFSKKCSESNKGNVKRKTTLWVLASPIGRLATGPGPPLWTGAKLVLKNIIHNKKNTPRNLQNVIQITARVAFYRRHVPTKKTTEQRLNLPEPWQRRRCCFYTERSTATGPRW